MFAAASMPANVASCDFPGTDDYLSRTHTLSNRRTWTFSFWAERDVTSALQYILSTDAAGADTGIIFPSTNTFALYDWDSATYDIRESGGSSSDTVWNHWCLAVDTTEGTAANRVKFWKNNSLISPTEFNTTPALNYQTRMGNATGHEIGRLSEDGTGDFNGRLAEICMVDGQALTPAAFASNNRPIIPNPTWGSGGFWLRFLNSTSLGKDYSGNGNDWMVNGSLTQSADIP